MADSIKQNVQWFPGHMAKTRREISASLKLVDAVVELLDARIPYSSRNPELDRMTSGKPRIILLNKCDMADERQNSLWLGKLNGGNARAIAVDCRTGKGLQQFIPSVKNVLDEKIKANAAKGMAGKPLRLMVLGIPNTGKSSFINRMAGGGRAKVADRPGVTRGSQWFAVGKGIELLDTPGVLWPKFEDPLVGDHLAFTGAIKDETLDVQILALRFITEALAKFPELLRSRYKLDDVAGRAPDEILHMIAANRGMLLRGGEADCERASVMLLDEFRGGRIGRITLERAEDHRHA